MQGLFHLLYLIFSGSVVYLSNAHMIQRHAPVVARSNVHNAFKSITASLAAMSVSSSIAINPANAASIAPLADVGLKEFLIKDGRQFLRLELPIGKECKLGISDEGKEAQEYLELIKLRFEQVGFTNPAAWVGALKDLNAAQNIINENKNLFLDRTLLDENKSLAQDLLDNKLKNSFELLKTAIRDQDISSTLALQESAAASLADLRALQLPSKYLPYSIPEEYSTLPRLLGRATVEITLNNPGKGFRNEVNKKFEEVLLTLIVDGYHAPLTSGNFIDLVQKKFYDGLLFNKIEELSVQTGDRSKGSTSDRTIPLELFYKKDFTPTYGYTSDEDMRATETMALPFQSYGALGMARNNEDADSGTTQVFFLKWRQALIAPGRNTLDGFYTCFGYIVKNADFLSQVNPSTKIVSARVVSGIENLYIP